MRIVSNPQDLGLPNRPLGLARVLLAHGELAPRLALQTILEAGGYFVDVAATPSEAIAKLDGSQYELVLTEDQLGARDAGKEVLAYARVQRYRPATALLSSDEPAFKQLSSHGGHEVAIYTENLPNFLEKVADLIGMRARRRYRPVGNTA